MSQFSLKKGSFLIVILLFPSLIYMIFSVGKHNVATLGYFGPKEVVQQMVDGEEVVDTIYHTIPAFSLTDHTGKTFTQEEMKGKVCVIDFFYTGSETRCPIVSAQMALVLRKYEDHKNVLFLSHSLDPENDTPMRMQAYAESLLAPPEKWRFLTGTQEEMYDLLANAYLQPIETEGKNLEEQVKQIRLVLVDQEGRVRAYFDGRMFNETRKLQDAIKLLLMEPFIPRKEKA